MVSSLSSPAPVPADPSVEQLLAAIAERDEALALRDSVIEALLVRVEAVESRLGQNSRNSSRPPSSDGYGKASSPSRAEQKAAGRRPGKQPGDQGRHLAQVPDPDEVVAYVPSACGGCGAPLVPADDAGWVPRQVFDLPPARLRVTEHRLTRRVCRCGTVTTAPAPAGVVAPTQYGDRLKALALYLMVAQHVPVGRTATLLREVFGASVSQGFLAGLLASAAGQAEPFLDQVRRMLVAAPVAHFDETGVRVGGRLRWLHSASDHELTLLGVHPRRGNEGIDAVGVLPDFTGVAVHDGHLPYRQYDAIHALCNAHHLRELTAVTERDPTQRWAADLAVLLQETNVHAYLARAAGRSSLTDQQLGWLRDRYDQLIVQARSANPRPPLTGLRGAPRLGVTGSLVRRLDERRDEVLRFATDLKVPFTNNQAERDLRMAKLQMKISGCWRTDAGAANFTALRSYISTLRKHGHNALTGLTQLINGNPWLPAAT